MIDAVAGILMKFGLEKAASQIQKWGTLKIRANMVLHGGNHREARELKITAVNMGERPIRIKKVMVLLGQVLLPPNIPPEIVAKLRASESKFVGVELSLFDGGDGSLEIGPHGEDHTWSMAFANDVKFVSEKKRGREYGRGYVLLTSGKKLNFKFSILVADQWERTVEAFSS